MRECHYLHTKGVHCTGNAGGAVKGRCAGHQEVYNTGVTWASRSVKLTWTGHQEVSELARYAREYNIRVKKRSLRSRVKHGGKGRWVGHHKVSEAQSVKKWQKSAKSGKHFQKISDLPRIIAKYPGIPYPVHRGKYREYRKSQVAKVPKSAKK